MRGSNKLSLEARWKVDIFLEEAMCVRYYEMGFETKGVRGRSTERKKSGSMVPRCGKQVTSGELVQYSYN